MSNLHFSINMFQHNAFISLPVVNITNHHPVITSVSLSYMKDKEYMVNPNEGRNWEATLVERQTSRGS